VVIVKNSECIERHQFMRGFQQVQWSMEIEEEAYYPLMKTKESEPNSERRLSTDLQTALSAPAPLPVCSVSSQSLATAFGRPRNSLNNRFVYTVLSQRAHGLSIGVNLTPGKQCNFDCVYCEVNRDRPGLDNRVDIKVMSAELVNLLRLVQENKLCELPWFRHLPPELLELKEVALSGDGEPTLCPNFGDIIRELARLRSQSSFFKIVLITNTAGLHLPEVRTAWKVLTTRDEIWVKLEAGTQEYMEKVNRPDFSLRELLDNILAIGQERPIIIQSLFPRINGEEPPSEEIEQYVRRLQELRAGGAQIMMVQIYSAHRPPHHPTCGHLPLKTLSYIARRVRESTGLKAEVF
jgi:wyosine [tRNA(Phe)-imidazoG37] synthetase (radical SAM superfamily)